MCNEKSFSSNKIVNIFYEVDSMKIWLQTRKHIFHFWNLYFAVYWFWAFLVPNFKSLSICMIQILSHIALDWLLSWLSSKIYHEHFSNYDHIHMFSLLYHTSAWGSLLWHIVLQHLWLFLIFGDKPDAQSSSSFIMIKSFFR